MRIAVVLSAIAIVAIPSCALAADIATPSAATGPAQANFEQRWNATFASEVRYYSWQSNRGSPPNASTVPGSGYQVYTPYALSIVGRPTDDFKVELLGRGGWVTAHQSTAGLSGTVSTQTDTAVSSTVTYLGFAGLQPFVSVSANLPTGRSSLAGNEVFARMDGDLVEISDFGEGFNIGPVAGLSWPVTANFVIAASAGYTWRNAFDRDRSTSADSSSAALATRIDPGDVWTVTASIAYAFGQFSGKITGTLSEETATVENGQALYKPGRRYLLSGSFSYNWEAFGLTTLNASMSHTDPNEVLLAGTANLIKEAMNTNSNLYRVGLQHLFPYDKIAFGPTGSFLFRDHNGYDPSTFQFIPAKERWAAGGLVRYAASDSVTLNARVDHVWTREDERQVDGGQQFSVLANAFVPASAVPVVSSTAWQVAGGVNVKF